MATPAEKKALLFLGVVTLLGGSVRLWRSHTTDRASPHESTARAVHSNASRNSSSVSAKRTTKLRTKKSSKKPPPSAWASPLDLDVASIADLEALGVLKPGIARMIIADRDSFGPFGSIRALSRVPYLRKTTITTLAPLVTFSRVPRPTNAVISTRPDTPLSPRSSRPSRSRSTPKPSKSSRTTAPVPHSNGSSLLVSTTLPPAPPAPNTPARLGDSLVREGLITREQLTRALDELQSAGGSLPYQLVKLGAIDELILTRFLAREYKVPAVDLSRSALDPAMAQVIPASIAVKHTLLALRREGRQLYVAMADPTNFRIIEDLEFRTRSAIIPVVAGEFTLRTMIERLYPDVTIAEPAQGSSMTTMDSLLEDIDFDEGDVEMVEEEQDDMSAAALSVAVNEAPVVKLINAIMIDAVQKGASDIHFECFEHELRVRYRIDGALREIMKPPFKLKAALISRFKIMASMNIAERRTPQDGRIKLKIGKRVIDFRVSTLPTLFGEKVVLRILDKGNLTLDLDKFGIEPGAERELMEAVQNPYGMVLVTGPTGSGKTTTLYSALSKINNPDVNIMTAEDPVEYNIFGINQVQVRTDIGMSFAAALKAFLRQDPNIIMVGEIRDFETGGIAIKAALTGHLVMSTLHTNSAPETVTRLLDMGLESFNVASALNLILAQRLVRRICDDCRVRYVPDDIEIAAAKVSVKTTLRDLRFTQEVLDAARKRATPEATPHLQRLSLDTTIGEIPFCRGKGCDTCNGTGLRGRQGLYEVMMITPGLRKLIMKNASVTELKEAAVDEGMLTLRMDGWLKVLKGITTLDQVIRETSA